MLFLCAAFLQVSANTYSQEAKLDLKVNNASLEQVMNNIRRQSEFSFFCDDAAVKNISNITLDVRNARIEEGLATCLKGTGFSFRILDKTIILFREQPQTVEQQKFYKVQGKVVDEKTLPIQVTTNYLKIADGYILYGTDISKETVTLSGPSTELSKVETCTAEVTYSGELTSPVTLDTGLRFYTRSGVEVTLQVYKLATLPVEVSFINAPRDFDPSVLVYSLSKKTLNVAGPESQIDRLSTLSVGTIDLSTFALDKVYEMPIELPSGIRLLDNISSITVSFDSSRLETKTMNLPSSCVQVVNLPSTYQLTVETERLMNVTLCGPKAALETLTPEQVVVEIDAEAFSVATGQQNIACRLYVPANDKIFALGSYVVQCKIESN